MASFLLDIYGRYNKILRKRDKNRKKRREPEKRRIEREEKDHETKG